jgi:AcrR family transcriptional regulator
MITKLRLSNQKLRALLWCPIVESMPVLDPPAEIDPRVRRTRQLLQQALSTLLEEKQFDRISIGEIAARATLSRATFYDHYCDKHSLLECMVAGRFKDLVAQRGITFTGCEGATETLVLAVCEYLVEMSPALRDSEKPLETAMVAVLRGMLLDGLQQQPPVQGLPVELIAATMAWAIYGAAREWVRTPSRMPPQDAAAAINRLLAPVMASLA